MRAGLEVGGRDHPCPVSPSPAVLHTDLPLEGLGPGTAVIGLAAAGLVYTAGWRRYHRRLPQRFAASHLAAFLGGLACLCTAIASPFDQAAAGWLSAPLAQHIRDRPLPPGP